MFSGEISSEGKAERVVNESRLLLTGCLLPPVLMVKRSLMDVKQFC